MQGGAPIKFGAPPVPVTLSPGREASRAATAAAAPERDLLIGIVDVLQPWDAAKAVEAFAKTHVLRKDGRGISAVPVAVYQARFIRFMAEVFGGSERSAAGSGSCGSDAKSGARGAAARCHSSCPPTPGA